MPQRPPRHRTTLHQGRALGRNPDRRSAAARGYDRAWERFRAWVLSVRPLCEDCEAIGRASAANEVHHVARLRDRPELRLDPGNVRALCKSCHSQRTGRGE